MIDIKFVLGILNVLDDMRRGGEGREGYYTSKLQVKLSQTRYQVKFNSDVRLNFSREKAFVGFFVNSAV